MNYKEAYEVLLNFQKDFKKVEKAFQKGAHELVANLAEELAAEIRAEFPNVDPHRFDVYRIDYGYDIEVDEDGTTWGIITLDHPEWNDMEDIKLNLSRLGGLYEDFPYIVRANYSSDELYQACEEVGRWYVGLYHVIEDLRNRINDLLRK